MDNPTEQLRADLDPDSDRPEPQSCGLSQILFANAARGSLDAHRQLREQALQMAADGAAPFDQAFAVAEVFGRLASSVGTSEDRRWLAALLFYRAEIFATDEQAASFPVAQALAQLAAAADDGDGYATSVLIDAAESLSPSIFDLATELRAVGAAA